ncbi:MAG: DUF255 domain-containing protein [Chitinophagaceae bacterium]|nr:MAG: DUF255 domain-containing protein [Chitinophagaceae bacterium]
MKSIITILCALVLTAQVACAADKKDKAEKNEIHWMSFEEAEAKMKEHPKKVLVDVYTAWCGWCKVMDKETYTNDSVIQYVNEHYYAVKFDAEQKTPITFQGRKWEFSTQNRANELAIQIMQGKMSYPTTILMDEGFTNGQPIPGYQKVFQMEPILKYFGGNFHKSKPYQEWMHEFKPAWK